MALDIMSFGTRGSQVQILPLRPAFSTIEADGERYGGRNAPPRPSASAAVLGRDGGEEHLTTKLRRFLRQLPQIAFANDLGHQTSGGLFLSGSGRQRRAKAPVTLTLASALDPYGGDHNEGGHKHNGNNDLATHHDASSTGRPRPTYSVAINSQLRMST